jgi:tetratricopeptide (TPR) repeat protein
MHGVFTWRRLLIVISLALGSASVLIFILGSLRYGGPDGLWLRLRTELAAYRPHPQFVPTPLPTPTGVPRAVADLVGAHSVSPLPDNRDGPGPIPAAASPMAANQVEAESAQALVATPVVVRATATAPPTRLPRHSDLTGFLNLSDPDTLTGVRPERPVNPTPSPAPTATPLPSPTPSPAPLYRPAAQAIELTGLTHVWQKWNNCGPATLAMNLSYYGLAREQLDVAAVLKPNRDDKNVSPEEMAAFARSQGLHALVRVNGDVDRLRLWLSNGVPVLIETWLEQEPGNGMGHYRLLTGYDDARQEWTVYDSYISAGVDASQPYRGIQLSYADVERWWAVFNRTYVLVYSDALAPLALSILGEDADEARMWDRALGQAGAEAEQAPDDPFARFNLGSDLVALGRFEEAATAYDRARVIGLPWRMLWYQFGPFRAYYETGRYQELTALAEATIATDGEIEETYYWKGMGLAAQGEMAGARQAWQHALALNPNYAAAAAALAGGDTMLPEGNGFE